jgi:hypothetical protein
MIAAGVLLISGLESLGMLYLTITAGRDPGARVFASLGLIDLIAGSLLGLLSCLFLYTGTLSFLQIRKNRGVVPRLLRHETTLWAILFGNVGCFSLLVFLMVVQNVEVMQPFAQAIEGIKIYLPYLFVLNGQFILASLLMILTHFARQSDSPESMEGEKEILPVLVLFFLLAAVKLTLLFPVFYGPVRSMDDMTYFSMAQELINGNFFHNPDIQYPPLYPISIMAALVFRPHAFEGIKLLNILFSSSIVLPLFLLARQFLHKNHAYAISLISCLIPYHLVFSGRIASEVLFFPLLMWAILVMITQPQNHRYDIAWNLFFGILLAALFLTRYITLAAIPFFLLGWLLNCYDAPKWDIRELMKRLVQAFSVVFALAVFFGPWVLLGWRNQIPLTHMLGFHIADNPVEGQLTFNRLVIYGLLYAAYLVLATAPVLHIFTSSIPNLKPRAIQDRFTKFVVSVLLIISGFFIAAVRHSWRAWYNAEMPVKLMGRYILYFAPVLMVIAFVIILRAREKEKPSWFHFWLFHLALPASLVLLSYLLLIERSVIPMGKGLIKAYGSIEGYYIGTLGPIFLPLIFAIYAITGYLIRKGRAVSAIHVLAGCLAIYYLAGAPRYADELVRERTYPWLSQVIASQMPPPGLLETTPTKVSILFPLRIDEYEKEELINGLAVRGYHAEIMRDDALNPEDCNPEVQAFHIQPVLGAIPTLPAHASYHTFYGQVFEVTPISCDTKRP